MAKGRKRFLVILGVSVSSGIVAIVLLSALVFGFFPSGEYELGEQLRFFWLMTGLSGLAGTVTALSIVYMRARENGRNRSFFLKSAFPRICRCMGKQMQEPSPPGPLKNSKHEHRRPPLSPASIIGELSAGAVGAIVAIEPLLFVIYVEGAREATLGLLFVLPVTYTVGAFISPLAVYLAGRASKQRGSLPVTLGCSMLAFPTVLLLSVFVRHPAVDFSGLFSIALSAPTMWAIALSAPTIFATIGFNLTRKYKAPPTHAREYKSPPTRLRRHWLDYISRI